jgi:hypothetical protein
MSLHELCSVLNTEGIPTRTGKRWAKGTLHQIITRGLATSADQG